MTRATVGGTAIFTCLAAAFGVGAIDAAEDGGTRSIFASGAGTRALSMGGAFTAVSDDLTSLIWNPGGLGLVRRAGMHVTHTNHDTPGLNESYIGLAFPSWRWGVAALGVRHFGADGIEPRDDRNFVTGDSFESSEMEIALGYGRTIGNAWSLGGTVKLQRQELAGFQGSGLGADLGVHVRPGVALGLDDGWSRLALGFHARNVIEPGVRLDLERVPDPTTMTAGLAWSLDILQSEVLWAFDVEQTRGGRAHVRTGMEIRPHALLTLRSGTRNGHVSTGASVAWKNLAIDYVFENRKPEAVHMVGLGWSFGRTTDEGRSAALDAEEAALQARIDDAFRERETGQAHAIAQRAEMARAAGQLDEAIQTLEASASFFPDHAVLSELHLRCLRERATGREAAGEFARAALDHARILTMRPGDVEAGAGHARAMEQSDRLAERTAEIRRRFDDAMDAFTRDDLVRARGGFREVLAMAPDDVEATRMLARTEEVLVERTAQLLRRARARIDADAFGEARDLLSRAAALDANGGELVAVRALLQQRQRTSPSSPSAPAARAAADKPTAATLREVDILYRRGLAAMSEERGDDALGYWELAFSMHPGDERVARALKREYLVRGMQAFARGRLHDAVHNWERVTAIDPGDQRAAGYLSRALEQLDRMRELSGGDQ